MNLQNKKKLKQIEIHVENLKSNANKQIRLAKVHLVVAAMLDEYSEIFFKYPQRPIEELKALRKPDFGDIQNAAFDALLELRGNS